jgi:hypothetical protein
MGPRPLIIMLDMTTSLSSRLSGSGFLLLSTTGSISNGTPSAGASPAPVTSISCWSQLVTPHKSHLRSFPRHALWAVALTTAGFAQSTPIPATLQQLRLSPSHQTRCLFDSRASSTLSLLVPQGTVASRTRVDDSSWQPEDIARRHSPPLSWSERLREPELSDS